MTALASTDVTVTLLSKGIAGKKRRNYGSFAFGDAALTYPATGVPLPAATRFGFHNRLDQMFVLPAANGYIYKYDKTYHSVRIYHGAAGSVELTGDALAAHTHDLKYIGGITATEPVAIQGGDTLGKNAATNRTVAGADSATKGGVVEASGGTPSGSMTMVAAPLAEVSTSHAPAATTLYFDAIGV